MRRRWVGVATAAILVGMIYFAAVANGNEADGEPYVVPTASKADLETLSESTAFFAHQSVGYNLKDDMPALYDRSGVTAPAIAESDVAESDAKGRITHVRIGKNGDPLGKIVEFDRIVRAGNPDGARVAASAMAAVLAGTVR